FLERALQIEPDHALGHAALAEAWESLGYNARARAEAKQATLRSQGLGREERLWIEGLYHEIAKEWDQAVQIHRATWTFSPDSLEYGLRLAGAELAASRPKEALATVGALRKLPFPASDDPRIDLVHAGTLQHLSDYRGVQALAARAAAKCRQRG